MTVKEFFKGKAFKCIVVLLCVLLVSGSILTICWGFLEVSAGERLQRAISKIYPGETIHLYGADDKLIEADDKDPHSLIDTTQTCGDAEILSAYKITFEGNDDVHYLVQSKGSGGYSEGTVTCWVAVDVNVATNKINKIAKVQVGESSGQTFMDKISSSMLDSFTTALPEGGFYPSDGYVATGATKSSTAICNAVNGAVTFVNTSIFSNVEVNPYENLQYVKYIYVNSGKTEAEFADNSSETVVYTVTTKGYDNANSFKIQIAVGADKKITSYEILTDGSTEGYDAYMPQNVSDGTLFVGKGIDFFTDAYGENMNYKGVSSIDGGTIVTGASADNVSSNSVYLCMYAGAFATANYDAVVDILNGGAENE